MRHALLTAAILACVLGLSACNDDPPGAAAPKTGDSGTTAASTKGSGKTGTPLANTDPCTLLKPADVPELDQSAPGEREDIDDDRRCAGKDFSVTIIDNDKLALEMDFVDSRAQPVPDIAGHRAVAIPMQLGSAKSCSVSMEVTADELVRTAVKYADPAKACDLAVTAATVVAGRIPA